MRHLYRFLLVVGISAITSALHVEPAALFFSTLYTVIGIFFSIEYSIIIGFDLSEITNESMVESLRNDLKRVERSSIVYFGAATLAFFISDQTPPPVIIRQYQFSYLILAACSSVYILIYLIVNFSRLQKLKDDISNLLRKEKLLAE